MGKVKSTFIVIWMAFDAGRHAGFNFASTLVNNAWRGVNEYIPDSKREYFEAHESFEVVDASAVSWNGQNLSFTSADVEGSERVQDEGGDGDDNGDGGESGGDTDNGNGDDGADSGSGDGSGTGDSVVPDGSGESGSEVVEEVVNDGESGNETSDVAGAGTPVDFSIEPFAKHEATLVAAGYDTYEKLTAATDAELEALDKIGAATVATIRAAVAVQLEVSAE